MVEIDMAIPITEQTDNAPAARAERESTRDRWVAEGARQARREVAALLHEMLKREPKGPIGREAVQEVALTMLLADE